MATEWQEFHLERHRHLFPFKIQRRSHRLTSTQCAASYASSMCSAWPFILALFSSCLSIHPSQRPSFSLVLWRRHTLVRGLWVSPVIITGEGAAASAAAQCQRWAAVQWANRLRRAHTWIIDQCDSEMTARGNRTVPLWGGFCAVPSLSATPPRCVRRMRKAEEKSVGWRERETDSSLLKEGGTWCGFFRFS